MASNCNFLHIDDLPVAELRGIVAAGLQGKQEGFPPRLAGKVMAMLFMQASTRTRVSFEAGMAQLGGAAIYLDAGSTQLSRGEPVADTARVISSMCDVVVIRAHEHDLVSGFAQASSVPVVNALTQIEHPCQILADIMTFEELRGPIAGRKIAWVGDRNNVCRTWMKAAGAFGFELAVATPALADSDGVDSGYEQLPGVSVGGDPAAAVAGAACVVTDVWSGLGDNHGQQQRQEMFAGFQVTPELMGQAQDDALFMHCLPAHRGEEVAAEVIDGPQSAVWTEAENRLHAQKALLVHLLAE